MANPEHAVSLSENQDRPGVFPARTLVNGLSLLLVILYFSSTAALSQPDTSTLLLAPARQGGLWGYINQKGEWVIPPQYGEARNFRENLAEVVMYTEDNIKSGFINRYNKLAISLPEINYSNVSEGMLAFLENGAYGYMDSSGNKVIPPQFRYCSNFENGKAMVIFKSGKAGYINRTKKLLLSPRWDTAFNFQGKYAVVGKRDTAGKFKYGVIDQLGNGLVPIEYSFITNFSEDKAFANYGGVFENRTIKGGKWYIINMAQQAMLALCDTNVTVELDNYNEQYCHFLKFKDGLAWFPGHYNGKQVYGLMNGTGDWIVLPQFKFVNPVSEEMAGVYLGGKMGFIDIKGRNVIPCIYQSVGNFHNGLAWFKDGKKIGFMNKQGEIVIPPIFDEAGDFMAVK